MAKRSLNKNKIVCDVFDGERQNIFGTSSRKCVGYISQVFSYSPAIIKRWPCLKRKKSWWTVSGYNGAFAWCNTRIEAENVALAKWPLASFEKRKHL